MRAAEHKRLQSKQKRENEYLKAPLHDGPRRPGPRQPATKAGGAGKRNGHSGEPEKERRGEAGEDLYGCFLKDYEPSPW